MNVKFHKMTSYTLNFQNFTCVFTILVKFDIHFLGLPWEIFFGVTTDDLLHLKPLKNVKKNAIFFKLFWYKVFVPWKYKITEFSGEFLLNAWNFTSGSMMNDHTRSPIDFCFRGILRGASYSCSPEWHSEHPAGWS